MKIVVKEKKLGEPRTIFFRHKSTLAVPVKMSVLSVSACNYSFTKPYLTLPYLTKVNIPALTLPKSPLI